MQTMTITLRGGSQRLLSRTTEPEMRKIELVLIEAESLSLGDKFMNYQPATEREQCIKDLIIEVINSNIKNFYRPVMDPGYKYFWGDICYEPGLKPATDNCVNSWNNMAAWYFSNECYESRLGTRLEYGAFLGVLMKNLVEEGASVERVWDDVCNDSRALGYYWKCQINIPREIGVTGSNCICGFYDLANTRKMLAYDKDAKGVWIAGGIYRSGKKDSSIAEFELNSGECVQDTVGWLVFVSTT